MTAPQDTQEAQGRRITLVGSAVNIVLIAVKLVAGYFGRSQALIADGIHSASDLGTDIVVLVGLKLGRRSPDADHPFGHGKFETLGSVVVGVALAGTGVFLGVKAARAIYLNADYQPEWIAVAAAALSVVVKEILYQATARVGRRINSRLLVANAWHHRSDALSSVAVLAGVGAAWLNPAWHLADAFAALLVSFFVVKVGLDIVGDNLREITDAAPKAEVVEAMRSCAAAVPGVRGVHDLKVRTSGGRYQVELHVVVQATLSVAQGHAIAKEVEQCLVDEMDTMDRIIVHVDPDDRAPDVS